MMLTDFDGPLRRATAGVETPESPWNQGFQPGSTAPVVAFMAYSD